MSSEPPARRPTIYDVAKLAGVSHQTVAMVLRGQGKFRPQTLERVEAAISALRYRPNSTARALATSTANRIGALVFELLEVGPSKTVQGASRRAAEAGFLLEIVSLPLTGPDDGPATRRALGLLDRSDVAGILVFAPVDRLLSDGAPGVSVPVVMELEPRPSGAAPTLSERGMSLVVDHLAGLGHQRIGYLGGSPSWIAARRRSEAVRTALARHDLSLTHELTGDWSAASAARAVHALPAPDLASMTALICANDQMALGALLALDERGIAVPAGMSVTGFDGIPESGYLRPPLTTVRVDYARHGRELVDTLLTRIGANLPEHPPAGRSTTTADQAPTDRGAGDQPDAEPTPPGDADGIELLVRASTAPPGTRLSG